MLRYHKHNHILLFLVPTLLFILVLYLILPFGSEYSMNDIIEQPSISGTFRSLMAEEFAAQAIAYNNPKTDDWVIPVTAIHRGGQVLSAIDIFSNSGPLDKRDGGLHGAYDFAYPSDSVGTKCPHSRKDVCADVCLIAPISGTVCKVRNTTSNGHTNWGIQSDKAISYICIKGEGNNNGLCLVVEHLSDIPKSLTVGSHVEQGQFIGYQCSQGIGTGSHAHTHATTNTTSPTSRDGRLSDINDAKNYVLHSSVGNLVDKSNDFTKEVLDVINSKPHYESEVVEVQ